MPQNKPSQFPAAIHTLADDDYLLLSQRNVETDELVSVKCSVGELKAYLSDEIQISCEGATNDTGQIRLAGGFSLEIDGVDIFGGTRGDDIIRDWFAASPDFNIDIDEVDNRVINISNASDSNKRVRIISPPDDDNSIVTDSATNPTLFTEGHTIIFCLSEYTCVPTASMEMLYLPSTNLDVNDPGGVKRNVISYSINGVGSSFESSPSAITGADFLNEFAVHLNAEAGYLVLSKSDVGGSAITWDDSGTLTMSAGSNENDPQTTLIISIVDSQNDFGNFMFQSQEPYYVELHSCGLAPV